MNIFVVDSDPRQAARDLCNKHVVKMIVESAQMLSTAHRVIDGKPYTRLSRTGRRLKCWSHPNERMDSALCLPTMVNHPCTKWVMENDQNYLWLHQHTVGLLDEYTVRYHMAHSMDELIHVMLKAPPEGIAKATSITSFAQAMPDQYRVEGDAVTAYRNYYAGEKRRFAVWKNARVPQWWKVEA